ncbi:hypothetical protein SAMN04489730_4884 [Amycolatopsis australiensis]|uniref:Uncharacterized protein n=1 Tax=Amycolatopsis australiensis TaxID=546364 RepID=A0A1K1S6D9_9PSEU|nr:hypothetical protein SAMN04489730_4884 [Amycolatopsis australiensis]
MSRAWRVRCGRSWCSPAWRAGTRERWWLRDAVGRFEAENGEQQGAVLGVVRRRCHHAGTVVALVAREVEAGLGQWWCRGAPHRRGRREVAVVIGPPPVSAASGGTAGGRDARLLLTRRQRSRTFHGSANGGGVGRSRWTETNGGTASVTSFIPSRAWVAAVCPFVVSDNSGRYMSRTYAVCSRENLTRRHCRHHAGGASLSAGLDRLSESCGGASYGRLPSGARPAASRRPFRKHVDAVERGQATGACPGDHARHRRRWRCWPSTNIRSPS